MLDLKAEVTPAGVCAEAGRRIRPSARPRSLSADAARSADGAARRASATEHRAAPRAARASRDAARRDAPKRTTRGHRRAASPSRSTPDMAARIPARSAARHVREERHARDRAQAEAHDRRRAGHARDADARRRLLRAARRSACRRRGACRPTSSFRSTPTRSASRRRAARRCSRCPSTARPARRRAGSRRSENAADLIGGVNLDGKDPVLARTLLDLSQTAQISDSLKVGRHVLDGIGDAQRAAQAGGRAGRLRGAEGARHSVDPGRDGVHLQSRRGTEAAQRAPPAAVRRIDRATASSATSRAIRRSRVRDG